MPDTFEGKQLKALPFLLQTNHYSSLIGVAVARRICNEVIFFSNCFASKVYLHSFIHKISFCLVSQNRLTILLA